MRRTPEQYRAILKSREAIKHTRQEAKRLGFVPDNHMSPEARDAAASSFVAEHPETVAKAKAKAAAAEEAHAKAEAAAAKKASELALKAANKKETSKK